MPKSTPNQLDYYERIRKLSLRDRNAIRSAFSLPLHSRPTMDSLARKYKVSRSVIFRIVHTPVELEPEPAIKEPIQ